MRILVGRLRYQHRPPHQFKSAAGVARTWLPGWLPAQAQRLVLPSALAAAPWVSLGRMVQQQAPLLQVPQVLQARRLQVPLLLPQVPQPLQGWRVWAHPGVWFRGQAPP